MLNDRGFIFDPNTGESYQVNATGLACVRGLQRGATVDELVADLGIGVLLPDAETLASCGKARLSLVAAKCGIAIPATAVARDVGEALEHAEAAGYPVYLKGPFYDATLVHNPMSLAAAAAAILADWGPPLMVQQPLTGTEFNVMGLGDGRGGLLGHCAVRKLIISDKGKGNGSVIVRDPRLDELTRQSATAGAGAGDGCDRRGAGGPLAGGAWQSLVCLFRGQLGGIM